MQIIFRASLKDKQAAACRDWEEENRKELQDNAPPGWTHAGMFFTVYGFGKYDVETRWELSSYGALDSARDHDNETWNKLNLEYFDFLEPTIPGETYLMRGPEDVKILE